MEEFPGITAKYMRRDSPIFQIFGSGIAFISENILKANKLFEKASSTLSSLSKKFADFIADVGTEIGSKLASKTVSKVTEEATGSFAGSAVGSILTKDIWPAIKNFFKKIGGFIVSSLFFVFKLVKVSIVSGFKLIFTVIKTMFSTFSLVVVGAFLAVTSVLYNLLSYFETGDFYQYTSYALQGLADWWYDVGKNIKKVEEKANQVNEEIAKSKALNLETGKLLRDLLVSWTSKTRVPEEADRLLIANAKKQQAELAEEIRKYYDIATHATGRGWAERRNEAAKKLKDLNEKYVSITDLIKNLEESIYSRRKANFDRELNHANWLTGEYEKIYGLQKNGLDIKRRIENKILDLYGVKGLLSKYDEGMSRLADLYREYNYLTEKTMKKTFGKTIKRDDLVEYYKKQQNVVTQIAQIRVDSLNK